MPDRIRRNAVTRTAARLALVMCAFCQVVQADDAGKPNLSEEAGIRFFEEKVRPLLATRCYECHGPQKQFSGLRLDSRDGILRGGDSGPSAVVGKPQDSELMAAVRRESFEMPPDEPLPTEEIEILEEWIELGMPWPAGETAPEQSIAEVAEDHWAFQPITKPVIPDVDTEGWARNEIDRFILRQLEDHGLSPAPEADRATLLRRLHWNLTGLPPTFEETSAFANDCAPGAYLQVVERLLASPHFGERWARHWLDVARYADTKGYVFFEPAEQPSAFTYRDYVIDSFNGDKPFDEFVVEQLAADFTSSAPEDWAALGYLTVGARFKNNQPDIIDDRIDVVTRGLMGLTVSCARCHDHKFDPIGTADYYSLYGVFANSVEPVVLPFVATGIDAEHDEKAKAIQEAARAVVELQQKQYDGMISDGFERLDEYLQAAQAARSGPDTAAFDIVSDAGDLNPQLLLYWQQYLDDTDAAPHPVWKPWHRLAAVSPDDFSVEATAVLSELQNAGSDEVNRTILAGLAKQPLDSFADVVAAYARILLAVNSQWLELKQVDSQASGLPDASREEVRRELYDHDKPLGMPFHNYTNLQLFPDRDSQKTLRENFEKLRQLITAADERYGQALLLADAPVLTEPRIFMRGNPARPEATVPRKFLSFFDEVSSAPFENGSGRLQLAEAIVSDRNPLTARVIVNRLWHHHFGTGLVDSPSNFGLQGSEPSHPKLLAFLAAYLIEHDWSLKSVHRLIVNSATFRQSSDYREDVYAIDPDNRLLGRMNRRRQELETLNDALLAVSGRLDDKVGGPSVKNMATIEQSRRSMYGFVDRQNLPGLMRTFDFPNPDISSPARNETTVPAQTLFLMNHPVLLETSRRVVARLPENAGDDDRIAALYQTVLRRLPSPDEVARVSQFLASGSGEMHETPRVLWEYGYGELNESSGELLSFEPLPFWTGEKWQGGPTLPDAALGWVYLEPTGGHPGNNLKHAAVARWTCEAGGTYEISGDLNHVETQGDGVRGRVNLNGQPLLAASVVNNSTVSMSLETVLNAGDTLEFVVDIGGDLGWDMYEWTPVIQDVSTGETVADYQREFGASESISWLGRWEQLAQVLLMSNEFQFVD